MHWSDKGWLPGRIVELVTRLDKDRTVVSYNVWYDDDGLVFEEDFRRGHARLLQDDQWQRLELRCCLTGAALTDPAILPGCAHHARCNHPALVRSLRESHGNCPVAGCSTRRRPRDIIRLDGLREQILKAGLADGREVAWIKGDQIRADPPQQHAEAQQAERRWVQCDDCDKWRSIDAADATTIGETWRCSEHPDPRFASCALPEEAWEGETWDCPECAMSRDVCARCAAAECEQQVVLDATPVLQVAPRSGGQSARMSRGQSAPADGAPPGKKRVRCRQCVGCLTPDCRECSYCRDNPKYGGPGTQRQACKLRRCADWQQANPRAALEDIKQVRCDACKKWRLCDVDPETLPEVWHCNMSARYPSCDVPEDEVVQLANNARGVVHTYAEAGGELSGPEPGTIVWAKMRGFPTWPARCEPPIATMPSPSPGCVLVRFFGWKASSNLAWVAAAAVSEWAPRPDAAKDAGKLSKVKREQLEQAIREADEATGASAVGTSLGLCAACGGLRTGDAAASLLASEPSRVTSPSSDSVFEAVAVEVSDASDDEPAFDVVAVDVSGTADDLEPVLEVELVQPEPIGTAPRGQAQDLAAAQAAAAEQEAPAAELAAAEEAAAEAVREGRPKRDSSSQAASKLAAYAEEQARIKAKRLAKRAEEEAARAAAEEGNVLRTETARAAGTEDSGRTAAPPETAAEPACSAIVVARRATGTLLAPIGGGSTPPPDKDEDNEDDGTGTAGGASSTSELIGAPREGDRVRLQWRPGPREGTFDGVVMSVDTNLSKKQQADGVKLRFEVHYDDHDRRIHAFPCAVDKIALSVEVLPALQEDTAVTEEWEKVLVRCAVTQQRLVDPAKGRNCVHVARCNYADLRWYLSRTQSCPCCQQPMSLREVERDQALRARLHDVGTAAGEFMW